MQSQTHEFSGAIWNGKSHCPRILSPDLSGLSILGIKFVFLVFNVLSLLIKQSHKNFSNSTDKHPCFRCWPVPCVWGNFVKLRLISTELVSNIVVCFRMLAILMVKRILLVWWRLDLCHIWDYRPINRDRWNKGDNMSSV